MRYLLLSLLALLPVSFVQAQLSVPPTVAQSFRQSYGYIRQPFWEMREDAYVAMFADEDGLKKVFFETDGRWRETRTRVSLQELPPAVSHFIQLNYEDADKTYIGRVDSPDGVLYRIESELPDEIIIKLIDIGGKLQQEQRVALPGQLPASTIIGYSPDR